MALRELAAGAIVTVIIGGGAYTVSQQDVSTNLATDTGMSQQEAENYVANVSDEDLVSYDKLGSDFIDLGKDTTKTASEIDCVTYEYEWESPTLTCQLGKTQLLEMGTNETALGNSYKKLQSSSASSNDISATIALIDRVNASYSTEIASKVYDPAMINEEKKTNSYNKATLQAALQSE